MKRISLLVLGLVMTFGMSSCIKEEEPFDFEAQFEREKPIIAAYVAEHIPNAILDEEWGIWYEVIEEGSGDYVYTSTQAPLVTVRYKGQLLSGTVFDEQAGANGISFVLSQVLVAWQAAFLPSSLNGLTEEGLQAGSKIRFVTPSYYAYANSPRTAIPANSPLDFTIEVINVTAPQ